MVLNRMEWRRLLRETKARHCACRFVEEEEEKNCSILFITFYRCICSTSKLTEAYYGWKRMEIIAWVSEGISSQDFRYCRRTRLDIVRATAGDQGVQIRRRRRRRRRKIRRKIVVFYSLLYINAYAILLR